MKPYLVCYVDTDHDMTLVRGREASRVLQLLGATPAWSPGGGGWVVRGTEWCHDIQAYANSIHEFAVISYRRPA